MSEADGNTGELRDIAYNVECLVDAVERIEKALVPPGSERERIALMFCPLTSFTPVSCCQRLILLGTLLNSAETVAVAVQLALSVMS